MTKTQVTRLDYCQYLLSTQINYTLTNLAEHMEELSHDAVNRYLAGDQIRPCLVWENVEGDVVKSEQGYVIFDDTVLDKRHSFQIELVRSQWSGNAKGVIKGIGVVTCVYVNPEIEQFWVIDYRIYAPESDGKSKIDHVQEMLANIFNHKELPFQAVMMDTWYATKRLMIYIESINKIYYCPLKRNRKVDDSNGAMPYQRIEELSWSDAELEHGKLIKIHGFPRNHRVKLFRVASSTRRTDFVVTNDLTQNDTSAVRVSSRWRWSIEQFHRESKQLTGIEKCQCRKARTVRNHIGAAMLVWVRLKSVARQTHQTIYQVKHGLLSDYLRQQLRNPSISMSLA